MPMKKNVVVFNRLAPDLVERLAKHFNVVQLASAAELPDALAAGPVHGLIGAGWQLGRTQLAAATDLEVVSSISVGYDNYDLDYLNERGILLTNTPDVLTETTADLAMTLMLTAARRIVELDGWLRAGNWRAALGQDHFGCDVHGKTLGIIGLGNIGAAIARRGRFGFGMRVLYTSNNRKPELEQELGADFRDLDGLLGESDFVCVVVPLSERTHKLIGQRELGLMKSSAILVNVARGQVVDEVALVEALRERQIRAAGLDVYEQEPLSDSPLFGLNNLVCVPHIGSATHETRRAMAELAVQNLESALLGDPPLHMVNPQVKAG
ncbi:gluconate 2-dehydrogenase [Halopseudomonas litoralis]|uniref:Gluconate 2-dehydrogenase n=2 Tax=Halopseudomonas litoralis TaxID=797277 RepID=A0A1H1MD92_9GAMM|nr:gluconate 2-dehydrogenase [Halopseudomonas litoralis]